MKTITSIVFGSIVAIASISVQADTDLFVPYFPPVSNCYHTDPEDCPASSIVSNGYLHIVNRGTSSATVIIKGKDEGGVERGNLSVIIPAGAIQIIHDHILEGTGGLSNGTGRWSLKVESAGDISVVPFRKMGNIKFPLPVEKKVENPPLPSLSFNQTLSTLNCEKTVNVDASLYVNINENYRHGRHKLLLVYQRGSSGSYVSVNETNWNTELHFHSPTETLFGRYYVAFSWYASSDVPKPLSQPFAGRWIDVVSGEMGSIINANWCP